MRSGHFQRPITQFASATAAPAKLVKAAYAQTSPAARAHPHHNRVHGLAVCAPHLERQQPIRGQNVHVQQLKEVKVDWGRHGNGSADDRHPNRLILTTSRESSGQPDSGKDLLPKAEGRRVKMKTRTDGRFLGSHTGPANRWHGLAGHKVASCGTRSYRPTYLSLQL